MKIACSQDIPAAARLYQAQYEHMSGLQPHFFRPGRVEEGLIADADELSDILLLWDGDRAVGFALVQERATPDIPCFIPRRYAYLLDILVDEASRGTGGAEPFCWKRRTLYRTL